MYEHLTHLFKSSAYKQSTGESKLFYFRFLNIFQNLNWEHIQYNNSCCIRTYWCISHRRDKKSECEKRQSNFFYRAVYTYFEEKKEYWYI